VSNQSKNFNLNSIQYKNLYGEKIACIDSEKEKAVVLFLNGYNFSIQKALTESNFFEEALKRGYSIVVPEVKKTTYAKKNYAETADFLRTQKKLSYYTDTLVNQFIKGNYKDKPLFIYGISTGARGSLLITEELQTKIKAVALLSGDYDQTIDPKDNLMVASFGPFKQNTKRWEEEENPIFKLHQLKCPIYIYHSKADKIVAFEHSNHLNTLLNKQNTLKHFEIEINQNHDFNAWNSKTYSVLDFFDEKIEK
jgi:alpha-beta hydrolase superfamily lysophospholipase